VLEKMGMCFDGETEMFGIHVARYSLVRDEYRGDASAYELLHA
jgi:hypothetical protein